VTSISGDSGSGAFGPMVRTLYEARRKAIGRMEAECQELGGHGVVGVRLSIGSFPAGGLEFKAIGTAVRAPGAPPLRRVFTPICPARTSPSWPWPAGSRPAWCSASRSAPGTTTG